MIGYYFKIALHNLRMSKILSAVMVFAVALGIGASSTMLTVLHSLSGDPIPDRSALLFHPQVDPRPREIAGASNEPPDNLTWQDSINLYALSKDRERTLTGANWLPAQVDRAGNALAMVDARGATSSFFSLFGIAFIYGAPWSEQDDDARALKIVLTKAMNERIFGGSNSVGRTVIIATKTFQVAGVIEDWNPQPHFYDLGGARSGAYGEGQQLFMPFFTWLDLPQDYGYGAMECWGSNADAGKRNPRSAQCAWIQMWVRLDNVSQVHAYRQALENYSSDQFSSGRFERPANVRLRNVQEWLDYKRVIPSTVRMQAWIAFGMLFVCLVNSIGLLMAKFIRRAGDIGVRRALGATRRSVFIQCLVEAGLIGFLGGVIGIPLSWVGLAILRTQPISYAKQLHVDAAMVGMAVVIAIGAALLAGIWPAWRASRIAPVLQMKLL